MAEINVLIIVDTVTTENVSTTVYMVDDNPSEDHLTEGRPELIVNVAPEDTVNWRATSVNQSDTIQLTDFVDQSGQVFSRGPSENNGLWTATVGDFPSNTTETYTFKFTINNGSTKYSWDPQMKIKF